MPKATVTTKVLSFLQSLQQSPQDQLQEELLFRVQEKKSHWDISIAKSRAELARAKRNLADAYKLADIQGIIDYSNAVTSIENGLAIIEEAFVVLFPAEA